MAMVLHPEEDLVPIERVGLVTMWLVQGEPLTIQRVKKLTGYRRLRDAKRMLETLSRVIPIYENEDTGVWEFCYMREST